MVAASVFHSCRILKILLAIVSATAYNERKLEKSQKGFLGLVKLRFGRWYGK